MSEFELLGEQIEWRGKIITAGTERFRHEDGEEVSREKVWHPGAVGVLALDSEHVWLTRQPREAAGLTASLEIPAGKLDVPGEAPLRTGRRELVEEIGKQAGKWEELFVFYTSPGFSDERVWLYLATDLSDSQPEPAPPAKPVVSGAEPEENERIEIVPWPLPRLDSAIAECQDSKSLIALLYLARRQAAA